MNDKKKVNPRKVVFNVLSFANQIIPKSDKKIFFYDSTFRKDNLWALYRYLSENGYSSKYKIIYYTKHVDDSFKDVSNANVVFTGNNLIGLYHHLTSKYVFWAFGTYRFMCRPGNGQKITNLWHGSPLKKVGYLSGQKTWYKYEDSFSYTICASDFFKDIMQKCFGFNENQGVILGAPRNDYIFSKKDCFSLLNIDKSKFSKVVLWMPTFRKSESNNYLDSDVDFPLLNEDNITELNDVLLENKVLMIIKPHPFQESLPFLQTKNSNILILNNIDLESRSVELYELLGQVDVLLTDYSSVYFDFLLTQKPIGFVLDDIKDYGDKRGFTIENPLDIMPGEKIYTFNELNNFINNLRDGQDVYKDERNRINDLVNKYQDDKNCERIVEFLDIK